MEWKDRIDEMCAYELEEQIIYSIKIGFLSNEEIQEECEEYIENYDDVGKISSEEFLEIVMKFRKEFQNVGEQENFLKLDLAFKNMEKQGIVALHEDCACGFEDCTEIAAKRYENGEKVIGCCFYTSQDVERILDGNRLFYFSFGNCFEEPTTEEVGQIIVEELEKVGFVVQWNQSADTKIAIVDFVWDKKYCE